MDLENDNAIEIDQDAEISVDEQFDRQKSKFSDFLMNSLANVPVHPPLDKDFTIENTRGDLVEVDFLPADNLLKIGQFLIRKYNDSDFGHLHNARIRYLWKRKGGETGGRATLGKCIKPGGIIKYFASETDDEEMDACDYIVWAAADHARTHQLKLRGLQALVFHELLHTERVDGKFKVRTHDFEGFSREIQEFGMWKNDIKTIAAACESIKGVQQGLFN